MLLALIAVALAASACSGGSASSTAPSSEAGTATVAASPTAVATPTAGVDAGPAAADGQRAYAHVRKLAVDIGPRVAGTPGETAARDYITSTLESYGYDVTVQDFAFDASSYLPARVDAGASAMPAFSMQGSAAGTADGPLVLAGTGVPEAYPPGGVNGGIALVQRSDVPFSDTARNAIAAGASGVIIYNNDAGVLLGDLGGPVGIPVVGMRRVNGEDLAARAAAGRVEAKVTVPPPKGTAYNVIARPKGVTQCATVTGGHYDSVAVTGGADDNAAGAASVLEAARVAAAMHLSGANCFVAFSAEEFGLFGSKEYVARLSGANVAALRGMINLDVVGVKEALNLIGSADLVETARLAAQELGVSAAPATLPKGSGSDHLSFEKAGVPVLMLYRNDDFIHTPTDAIDRIDAGSLQETVAVAVAVLQALNGG